MEKLSFKPFIGFENYLDKQDSFTENGGLELYSKGYTHYLLALSLGAEFRYELDSMFYYLRAQHENKLYQTHKSIFFEFDSNKKLRYSNEYSDIFSLHLGAEIFKKDNFKLNIQSTYKHYSSGLNIYQGGLLARYFFN